MRMCDARARTHGKERKPKKQATATAATTANNTRLTNYWNGYGSDGGDEGNREGRRGCTRHLASTAEHVRSTRRLIQIGAIGGRCVQVKGDELLSYCG